MKNYPFILFLISISAFTGCVSASSQDSQSNARVKPNFLLIYTDDQRTETLSCYDEACPISTPSIDHLANEGIRFTNGFVTTPICGVSRACFISGQYMSRNKVRRFQKSLPEDVFADSYPPQLKEAGYYLGIFGKYGFGITKEQKECFDDFDADTGQGPAFRNYKGKKMHDAEWLTQKTSDFLGRLPEGQPFCLQLNYKEPHPSSVPAPEDEGKLAEYSFKRAVTDTPEDHARLPRFVQTGYGTKSYKSMFGTDGKMQKYLSHYYEKIMSVERSIGNIMKMLKEKGIADNTVIIYLSDHGTQFGEKQLGAKWTAYEPSLRIPFIVYDPRPAAKKGIVSDEMVLNIDIAPTILDLAGVQVPEAMDGKSLKGFIDGGANEWRDHFFHEHFVSPTRPIYIPRSDGVRTKDTKYIRWIDLDPAVEELYDLNTDPTESNNLVNNPEYALKLKKMRKMFNEWRAELPAVIEYRPYQKYSQSGAKDIDWKKFKKAQPKYYAKIKTEVEKMGVSWEQAVDDWSVRYKICKNVDFWY